MPIVAIGGFSCNSYSNCRFLQDGQNCDGDSCAFGQHFPSGATKKRCFGWQDSRDSDDGTSMVCYSGTTSAMDEGSV